MKALLGAATVPLRPKTPEGQIARQPVTSPTVHSKPAHGFQRPNIDGSVCRILGQEEFNVSSFVNPHR